MKLEAIQQALREEGIGGWLFYDHHRRDPLAYRILQFTPASPVTRRWFYFIPAEGEPRGLVHKIEAETLRELPGKVATYAGWEQLTQGLKALLGGAANVAMQYSPNNAVPYVSMVDGGTVDLVRSFGVEVVTSANLVQVFEARWNAAQLENHLDAGRRMDKLRAEAFARIGAKVAASERVTEFEMKQWLLDSFAAQGMTTDHGPDVAVNANASNPHYEPTREASSEIKAGDSVLIDMWAKLDRPDGVYYDITWVGYCGEQAPEKIRKVFEIVRDARDAAIARVQRAVAAGEPLAGYQVDDAARGFIREAGYVEYFFHRTGHSIGADVHGAGANMDNLETHDERRVIAGTCFSIEPGIYLPEFGIRSEVNVYVGEKEARVTGEVQRELVRI